MNLRSGKKLKDNSLNDADPISETSSSPKDKVIIRKASSSPSSPNEPDQILSQNNSNLSSTSKNATLFESLSNENECSTESVSEMSQNVANVIHRRIVLQPELAHLKKPSLKQVQNIVNNYRINSGLSNSTVQIKTNLKFGFKQANVFNVKKDEKGEINLGDGSDENHLNICITSKKLLLNLDSSLPGAYHIDGTYKLISNRFPLIVFGKTDMNQKFYLIALCITSHEHKTDFF
ncbi:unnamed protein product [Brachionus calyciflorus]|uniref:MULE transposase domain-containing protein n=1 Tax=Brachionus calyciflorus TaxID=104777 RepID=A0A813M5U3_9BILA|nr:unnamed protein product [Brachionus calyciflorus]